MCPAGSGAPTPCAENTYYVVPGFDWRRPVQAVPNLLSDQRAKLDEPRRLQVSAGVDFGCMRMCMCMRMLIAEITSVRRAPTWTLMPMACRAASPVTT